MNRRYYPSLPGFAKLTFHLKGVVLWVLAFGFLFGVGERAFGQSPGGVSGGLVTWFKADSGPAGATTPPAANAAVTSWLDQSPSALTGLPRFGAPGAVTFDAGSMNFNPGVILQDNGVRFSRMISDDMTIFVVFRSTESTFHTDSTWYQNPAIIGGDTAIGTNPQGDFGLTLYNGQVQWSHDGTDQPSIVSDSSNYNNGVIQMVSVRRQLAGNTNFFENGERVGLNGTTVPGTSLDDNDSLILGDHPFVRPGTSKFDGTFGEVIMYNNYMGTANRRKVHSYLSLKYGVNMVDSSWVSSANDTIYDHLNGGTYTGEVFGIGRDNGSGLHQKMSRPSTPNQALVVYNGTVAANNPLPPFNTANSNDLTDGQFLIMGHDGGGTGFGQTFNGLANSMWDRHYKVENTGNVGPVTMFAPFTLGLDTTKNYYLVVSSDQTFDSSDDIQLLNQANGAFFFEYAFPSDISYFTFVETNPGPGGVSANLVLWYKADSVGGSGSLPTDGSTVTAWREDQGVYNSVSVDLPNGPSEVTVETGFLNFNTVVRCVDGGYVSFPVDTGMANVPILDSSFHALMAFMTVDDTLGVMGNYNDQSSLLSRDDNATNDDWGISMATGGTINYGLAATTTLSTPAGQNDGLAHIVSAMRLSAANPNDSAQLYLDGTLIGENNSARDGSLLGGESRITISNQPGSGGGINGYYGELILYDSNLSKPQVRKLQSYMAIKYGVTLPHDYTNSLDVTVFDNAGAGVYTNEIIGIGRDPFADLDQRQSVSTEDPSGMVLYHGGGYGGTFPTENTVGANPNMNPLDDFSFLMVGHDDASPDFNTTFNALANARMERVYRAFETDSIGTVTLFFPEATFDSLDAANQYSLILSSDGTIDNTDPTLALTNVPATNDFYVEVNFPAGQSFFTLVKESQFGPGGVDSTLTIWLKGDLDFPLNTNDTWTDNSGSGNSMTYTGLPANIDTMSLNFNTYGLWTSPVAGQFFTANATVPVFSIFAVGRVGNAVGVEPYYMGLTTGEGLLRDAGSLGPVITKVSPSSIATTANGLLYEDGLPTDTANIGDWGILSSVKDTSGGVAASSSSFFLGAPLTYNSFANYDFAEVAVFSGLLDATRQKKIESYLAIRYGITLGDTAYRASDNSRIFGGVGYSHDVAIIGRDDDSQMDQKQSKSVNPDAIVTISIDTAQAENRFNTGTFPVNYEFFTLSNDSGSACWTTHEIDYTPANGAQVWRLDREWSFEAIGAISQDIQLRIEIDNPNFDIPPVPTGATAYYLLLDPDGDFGDGNSIRKVFTAAAGNTRSAFLTSGEYGTHRYFTIATTLDTSVVDYCSPATATFYGSFLGNSDVCTQLAFDDGTNPPFLINTGDDITVTGDGAGNCMDTLSWVVDFALAGFDPYVVSVDTFMGVGCDSNSAFVNTTLEVTTDSVTIGVGGSTAFNFIDDSVCVNGGNVLPNTTGQSQGGVYFLDNSTVGGLTDNQILGSTSSGEILVYPFTVGTHGICYTLPGNCAGVDACDTITIRSIANASFSYSSGTVCNSSTIVDTLTSLSHPGGAFSSVPALADTASTNFTTTGAINPALQAPGTYIVTYVPPSDSCAIPVSQTVVINPEESLAFGYPDPQVCSNASNPLPVLSSSPIAGNFVCQGCGPLNLAINNGSGEIDLALSDPGTFTVAFAPSSGACVDTTTFVIDIVDPDSISAFTLNPTYCVNSGNQNITVNPGDNGPGITMVDLSNSLVFSQQGSTTWRLQTTGAPIGGPYPVEYTYTNQTTGCVSSAIRLTTMVGIPVSAISYVNDTFCKGNGNPSPQAIFTSGQGGGTFSSNVVGNFLDSSTGQIDIDSVPTGMPIVITYSDTFGICNAQSTVGPDTLFFYNTPDPNFEIGAPGVDSVCEGTATILATDSAGQNRMFLQIWNGGTQVGVPTLINGASGNLPIGNLGGDTTYTVYNIVRNNTYTQCRDTAYSLLRVNKSDVAAIDYGPDPLCSGIDDADPVPAILGTGGGFFFGSDSLVIDSTSGQIFLDATQQTSSITSHTVTYTTVGDCSDMVTIPVDVLPGLNAGFDYITSRVCNRQDTMPVDTVLNGGGVFTCPNCGALGASIDQSNGTLTFTNMIQTDTLMVTYSFANAGFCSDFEERNVIVEAFNNSLDVQFPIYTYCQSDTAFATVNGISSFAQGAFIPEFGLTFFDIDNGLINLGSSTIGPHTVEFVLGGACAESDTAQITILESEIATFNYPRTTYCEGETDTIAANLQRPADAGIFTPVTPAGSAVLDLNPFTGAINLANSSVANYTVIHTTQGKCPDEYSLPFNFSALPNVQSLTILPSDTVCGSDTVEAWVYGGGFPVFFVGGDTIAGSPNFEIQNPTDGLNVVVQLTTTDGCTAKDSMTITQNVVPLGDVTTWPSTISGDEELEIVITSESDNTGFMWYASSSSNATLEVLSDTTELVNDGQNVSILNNLELDSDFDPGSMEFLIVPFANGCLGDTIVLPIAINPNDEAIFIPGVFTPNGDNQNDTWQIQWRSDIDPEQHIIELYNRTGGLVYTMEGLTDTWTGENLPDGVYWYLVKDPAGESILAGGLTIRRR